MEHLKVIYERLLAETFPIERGREVGGVNLAFVNSDTLEIAARFFNSEGHLKADDLKILVERYNELKQIVPNVDKSIKQYFASMKQLAQEMLELASRSKLSESEIEMRYKWRNVYDQIKVIVNELDPLGVADEVDDEYGDLNFKVYSQLLQSKDEKKMLEAIKSYLRSDYEVNISDNEVMKAIKQLVKIEI